MKYDKLNVSKSNGGKTKKEADKQGVKLSSNNDTGDDWDAKDDEFGRKMQDLNMQVKKRAPKGER